MFKFNTKKLQQPSKFSRFFHEASSAEKKRVFSIVIRKASKEQRKLINS